jgi:hypothetical protein
VPNGVRGAGRPPAKTIGPATVAGRSNGSGSWDRFAHVEGDLGIYSVAEHERRSHPWDDRAIHQLARPLPPPLSQSPTHAQTATEICLHQHIEPPSQRVEVRESGSTAPCASVITSCAISTPAAPRMATPAAPVPCRARALQRPALRQHLSRGRSFRRERRCSHREPLAPLTPGAEVDVDEARSRIVAKAEELHRPRRCLKRHRIMVGHRDIERRPVQVLRARRAVADAER